MAVVTAKEQLQRRVETMSEAEAHGFLEHLGDTEPDIVAARLKAALDCAPPDDEPLTAEDEAAIAEAREQTERGEVIPAAQVYRGLFGH